MRREYKTDFSVEGKRAGRLVVRIPGVDQGSIPVELRDDRLRLIGRVMSDTTVTVAEGSYALRILFPDGSTEATVVEVPAGDEASEHVVRWRREPEVETRLTRQIRFVKASRGVTRGSAKGEWCARFLASEEGRWVPLSDPPRVDVVKHEVRGGVSAAELRLQAQTPAAHFLEVQGSREASTTVGMPLAAHTAAAACRVSIVDDGEDLEVNASLEGSGRGELVVEYLASGAVEEAADVMSDAEDLLYSKMSNPIEAAIGGYALLRLGDLERLHNWPMNLAGSFHWLPDGPIIAAELVARKGDHPSAVDFLIQATQRGLPLFSEGYSTAVSRLRQYSLRGDKLLPDRYRRTEIAKAERELAAWAHAVEYSSMLLTLRDVSLKDQRPRPASRKANDGWWKFAADTATQSGGWLTPV